MVNLTNIAEGEGGALHQLSLAHHFREFGHDVRMIAPFRHGPDRIPASTADVLTLSFSLTRLGLPGSLDALVQVPLVVWWRIRYGFEILYIRANLLTWLLVLVARTMGMKVVVEHNSWAHSERINRGGSFWLARIEGRFQVLSARLANLSRTVTRGIKRMLENEHVAAVRVVAIGNGTDVSHFFPIERAEALRALSWDPRPTRLGFIGGLSAWQGVETAIRAFALLKREPDLRLVIAGDGPERLRLEALAQELGVEDRVDFLGYVPRDMANLVINGFDLALAPFTHARNAEIGLSPIKIRDYAAAGRLVVCARIPEVSDLAKYGWMVLHNPDDEHDLAGQIGRCLSADFDRVSAQKAARAYAEEHFDWRRITQELVERVATV